MNIKLARASESISPLGLVEPPDLEISCPAFTGSLALLFECAYRGKVDLREVPLGPICEAYLEYLLAAEPGPLEPHAAGLCALAYLLERKAGLLLAREETASDPEPEEPFLGPRVEEFSPAVEALSASLADREQLFFRGTGSESSLYELPLDLSDVSPATLAAAFEALMRRAFPEPPRLWSKPRRSLLEQMELLEARIGPHPRSLADLMPATPSRTEAVWIFLALLELIRVGRVKVLALDGVPAFRSAPATHASQQ